MRCHSTPAIVLSMLCVAAALAAGCNGSPTEQTPLPPAAAVSFVGSWQGPVSVQNGKILQLEIAQAGENLTGRWTLASTAAADSVSGEIAGRVIGSAMALVLSSAASCPIMVSGTLETGTRLSGNYSTFSALCPSGFSTPIVLDRR